MTPLVIDASVAVKWVVTETGTEDALALRRTRLAAPDLLVAECANILWKKVGRGELSRDEASLGACRTPGRSGRISYGWGQGVASGHGKYALNAPGFCMLPTPARPKQVDGARVTSAEKGSFFAFPASMQHAAMASWMVR